MLYLTSFRANSGRAFSANRMIFKEGEPGLDQVTAAIDGLSDSERRSLQRIAIASAMCDAGDPEIFTLLQHLEQREGGLNGQEVLFLRGKGGQVIGVNPAARQAIMQLPGALNQGNVIQADIQPDHHVPLNNSGRTIPHDGANFDPV